MEPASSTPPPPPPPPASSFRQTWTRDQFRANARAAVDFIVSYLERLEQPSPPWPVFSQVEPGYLRPRLPASAPERPDGADGGGGDGPDGSGFASFLSDVEAHILPGLTHWQSPNFFSYFPANSSLPGVVGEMLCAALNVIGFSWAGSPAATELEAVVLDWVAEALGLPARFLSPEASADSKGGGCIQSTASDAVLVALLAARARALAPRSLGGEGGSDGGGAAASSPPPLLPGSHNEDADGNSRLVVYTSEQAHCCVKKAAMVAGIPFSRVREIAAPESKGFEIDAAALRAALEEDLKNGLLPCLVVATVGTTPTCAMDDLKAVAAAIDAAFEAARKREEERGRDEEDKGNDGKAEQGGEGKYKTRRPLPRRPWIHVDAAYAGVSALCPEYRDVFDGAERVDSLSTNFHKWCLTNFDCACFWVADSSWLGAALSLTPSYLVARNNDRDFRDWQVPLGRRFRSLKLWLVLRTYGLEGLRAYLRRHCELAAWLVARVEGSEVLELAAPPRLGLVCFRISAISATAAAGAGAGSSAEAAKAASSRKTALLAERVNARGKISVTSASLAGRCIVRVAIGGSNTTGRNVELAWGELVEVARGILEEE